jgi:hypothetical protein
MDNKKKYSFSFISFEAHKPPVIFEKKNADWIIFGDDKDYFNNYPKYLLDNYNKSAIHNAICNGKINYIVGSGLEVNYYTDVNSLAMAKGTIKSVNEYEDADDLNRKLATDLTLFGGFYAELIESKDGKGISAYHLSFNYIRRSKDDETLWYYTKDWDCRKPQQNEDFKEFRTFEGEFKSGVNYLVDYSLYRAGNEPYALPDYLAANGYIELDWRIGNFLLQNVKNGFSAGFMINFYNGHPEEEQKQDIERQIKKKFGGDGNGGSFVLNFNDPESKQAEIIPIPTNGHDDRFNTLKEAVRDNLFTSHNITNPMLFGVREAGSLGGRSELVEAFELMQNTYTNNRQRLLEKFWNDLLNFKGVSAKLEIVEVAPVKEQLSEGARLAVMTQDEIRGELGLEPLTNPNVTLTKFQDEKDNLILEHFEACGFEEEELEEVYSRTIHAHTIEEAQQFAEVTTFENSVLSILKDNPQLPPVEIAKALDVTPQRVMDALDNLQIEGYVKITEGQVEITESGVENAEEDEVFIVYKYALRNDAPSLSKDGRSRPFCRTLMGLQRSYTIEDIKMLRNGQGLDVFTSRGGWYTKKGTDTSVPYCRHTWRQRLVKLKKK